MAPVVLSWFGWRMLCVIQIRTSVLETISGCGRSCVRKQINVGCYPLSVAVKTDIQVLYDSPDKEIGIGQCIIFL